MPFRYNTFRDTIFQPNTDFSEIDSASEKLGFVGVGPASATIYSEFDQSYKIGGELIVTARHYEAEDDADPAEIIYQFDNFGTVASARAWLESLGFTQIEEAS